MVMTFAAEFICLRYAYSFRRYASNAGRSSAVTNPRSTTKAVRRKNRRQVGRRIQPRHAPEEGVVVVKHLLERRRGVVVEIGGGLADSAQLGDVHHSEVRGLPREQQSSRVRGRDELEGAVGERDAVGARVARQPLRTWREAVCGRARTGGLDVVIAHDGCASRASPRAWTRSDATYRRDIGRRRG